MSSAVAALWHRERGGGLTRLEGSRIRLRLPIREALVEHLTRRLRLPGMVRRLRVRFFPAQRAVVSAEVQILGFTRRLDAALKVAPVTTGPPLVLQLAFAERSLLSSAVSLAGSLLGRLPDGIVVDDRLVTVDVDRLAAAAGLGDLAAHIRTVELTTAEGELWVDAEAVVAGGSAPPPRAEAGAGVPGPPAGGIDPSEVLPYLRGLRVEASVRIEESLANEALEAVTADAKLTGHAPDAADRRRPASAWKPLVDAVAAPRVRFEAGAVVLEAGLALEP